MSARPTEPVDLVLAAQQGVDPGDLVVEPSHEVLRETARAASLLVGARMRHRAPCLTAGVEWRVESGTLTFDTGAGGRLPPALVCAGTETLSGGTWALWSDLWDGADPAGQRQVTAELLALLTAPAVAA
ncbi:hypothetical protein CHO01_31620 [Cellulomonas hominis]|uniref:Uncharacterized protein n=1 Tax=Cellulomonas hominis TaxID=156981 RepID=A0A511FFL9_9CELL|nr:hypothetical protein [Cellulomonas hominis]MBB5474778.1 hypothetical protein [Cellulomonas hominis]NKY05433.1 hypothetical protein [Cellulomonas hominis]GEL48046.1 hypothetical protein CHO01_31620 [Cellulomonas hominis]